MLKKLKSRAGLTLTELMVTMLLLTMFSMACLVGITSAFSARRDYIRISDADILKDTIIEVLTQELRLSINPEIKDDGKTISYKGGVGVFKDGIIYSSFDAKLTLSDDGKLKKVFGKDEEYSYHVLNNSAYGENGAFKIADLKFEDSDKGIKVSFRIVDRDDVELTKADFVVVPIND